MTKPLVFGIILLSFSISLTAQSPWARNKAGLFTQVAFHFIPTYTTLFGKGGTDIVLDHEVSERQIQLYGEYGLTKKTTLILSLPVVFNERGASNPDSPLMFAQEDTGSISGLGNTMLAVRHQFVNDKVAIAGTLRVGFPAGTAYKPLSDLRTGYDAVTVQPMVSIGKSLKKKYGYLYGSYGYRSNNYSHFLNFGAEAGVRLDKFWVIGFSELVYSLENGSRQLPGIDALTGLYINDQGWLSLGVKAIWQINRFVGITVSGAGAAWAQNVPKSPGIGLGLFFKWD